MKRKLFNTLFALVLALGFSLVTAVPVAAQTDYYVATTGSDSGGGTSSDPWATIGHALSIVPSGDTIHVAAGTYHEYITLTNGVKVLGAGRDFTFIEGGGSGTMVTATNIVDTTTTLDGFTITGGDAEFGGGMYNLNSSLVVSNCAFSSNTATYYGGGMYNDTSSPTVTDCIFSGNTAGYYGGGMCNINSSSPTVTNCTFSGNSVVSYYGGGMFNLVTSSPVVTNCTFSGNSAADYGGGMVNWSSSSLTVTNCTFSGNSATVPAAGWSTGVTSPH